MVLRHRTAISRKSLSLPFKELEKLNYLNGNYSILDYGCGRGDDIKELKEWGIDCFGYDPHFSPNVELKRVNIINLGFVINVIEDNIEREEILKKAYSLCDDFLIVSVRPKDKGSLNFQKYKDGIITKRDTFQKYYTRQELEDFVKNTLDSDYLFVKSNCIVVFKTEKAERIFKEKWRI